MGDAMIETARHAVARNIELLTENTRYRRALERIERTARAEASVAKGNNLIAFQNLAGEAHHALSSSEGQV